MNTIRRFLRAAGDVVLPRVCIVCGRRLHLDEEHICLGCLLDMPLTRFWERGHNPMADKFNGKIQDRPEIEYERYSYAAALFMYHSEAGYRQIPYQIKYQGNTGAGEYFGRMLGRKLAEQEGAAGREGGELWTDVDMVIPVPLHWTREWKRGYNQAEAIAGALAGEMDVPMRNDILIRSRRTKTQINLDIEDKAKNVSGAFAVNWEAVAGQQKPLRGNATNPLRHILLVDDVFTTGSTLAACFSTLRMAFPPSVRISAITLGYLER